AGPEGLSVGELRERLDLPPATLTAHLNVLRAAGLVLDQREGRVIRVRANYAGMDALLAYLTENCCAGAAECGPGACCPPPTTGTKRCTASTSTSVSPTWRPASASMPSCSARSPPC